MTFVSASFPFSKYFRIDSQFRQVVISFIPLKVSKLSPYQKKIDFVTKLLTLDYKFRHYCVY